ncbi:ABC transporter ATP-binding protein/permease [Ruminococcaceae bacterium OttesenSCG-928-L11]|nr:ABC transporter ATP-binding protein/permease [Ruminococcaceae bacterium OttesenSCG-928-L11]
MPFTKPKNLRGTLMRIYSYLAGSKWLLVLVVVCLLVSSGTSIASSYFLRPLINNYIIPGDFQGLAGAIGLLALIYLLGILASYLQTRTTVRLAQRTVNSIRKDMFDKLQNLPLRYFDTHSHGELMSRFTNDADNIQTMLEQSLTQFISSFLLFVGCVACMVVLSPILFVITVLVIALMFFLVGKMGKRSRSYFKKQQELLGQLNGSIEENLGGLKEIKAFNHEKKARAEFEEINESFRVAAKNANFFAGIMMPIMGNLNNMSYAFTAVFGGILTILGRFDVGSLASYLQFSRQVGQPINQITGQMNNIYSAAAGAERIFALMDEIPEVDEGTVTLVEEGQNGDKNWNWKKASGEMVPLMGDVRFENVHFAYDPEKPILKDISLYAKPGQMIAFVGSTGAGKTTITNLINRFYDVQQGKITYDGIDVREIEKDSLRKSLGMVLQDTHLFTDTVMGNIRYGNLNATDEQCKEAARKANAHSFITKLPQGYDTILEGDGGNLSQGQRQLIAIARAYISQPPVLILDEATSSIDTRTEQLVQRGMAELMKGRTVFVIAHRLSTVRNANAIVVLEEGRIIERGTHDELLEQGGRYYQLYNGLAELT